VRVHLLPPVGPLAGEPGGEESVDMDGIIAPTTPGCGGCAASTGSTGQD